ncbi:hypothetical protein [Pseudomonas sp. LB3P14]
MREIVRRGACSTAETYRTCLNQFFRYAIVEGGLDINPAADLDSVAVLRRIGRQRCALRLRCRGGAPHLRGSWPATPLGQVGGQSLGRCSCALHAASATG